jgi:FkbH-like protein
MRAYESDLGRLCLQREYTAYGTFGVHFGGDSQSCLQQHRALSESERERERKESCTRVNVVLLRLYDLAVSAIGLKHPEQMQAKLKKKKRVLPPKSLGEEDIRQAAEKAVAQAQAYQAGMDSDSGTFTLILFCPSPGDAVGDSSRRALYNEVHQDIKCRLEKKGEDSLLVLIPRDLLQGCRAPPTLSAHDCEWYYNEQMDRLAHSPFTDTFYRVVAQHVVKFALVCCSQVPRKKVICIDCDNTLWGGSCAELGASVDLSVDFLSRQRFFVALQEQGVLLCLVSRNLEKDVLRVFEQRKADMVLSLEHVAAHQINWNKKSDNLSTLAAHLGVGMDSFVFVDDSPVECEDVRTAHSAVSVLHVPVDTRLSFIENHWAFHALRHRGQAAHTVVTEEDKQRTFLYQQKLAREKAQSRYKTYPAFLASLKLVIDVQQLACTSDQAVFDRAPQLTERTNQMNCAKEPLSPDTLRKLIEKKTMVGWTVSVGDRFGFQGLVGVVLADHPTPNSSTYVVCRAFTLSCRSLQLGVEHAMLRTLGQLAKTNQKRGVAIRWCPAERNAPSYLFLQSVNGVVFEEDPAQLLGAMVSVTREPEDGQEQLAQPTPPEHQHVRSLQIPREKRHLWYDGRKIDSDLLHMSRASQKKQMRARNKQRQTTNSDAKRQPKRQQQQPDAEKKEGQPPSKQSIPAHVVPDGVVVPKCECVVYVPLDAALSAEVSIENSDARRSEVQAASKAIQEVMMDTDRDLVSPAGDEGEGAERNEWGVSQETVSHKRRKMRHVVKSLLHSQDSTTYAHVVL